MRKTRILIANDASNLGTGYGVYGKELLTRLHNTGKYEIAELACYVTVETAKQMAKTVPWKIYPNAVSEEDTEEQRKNYSLVPYNAFGAWRFDKVCLHFKPDIVFDVRDYWMYAYQETSPCRPFFKWVVMPTVDSAPQKNEWLHTFASMDLVVPYTEWARDTLTEQCKDTINLFPEIANAGVDLDVFKPSEDRKALQKKLFGEELEITGCVMRNQKRKLIPNVLKSYRDYLDRLLESGETEKYNKSYLYLHTSYPEHSGWDLAQLLVEHNMLNKTYFTNLCLKCKSVSISKFHHHASVCDNCGGMSCTMPNAGSSVETEHLVTVYQLFDLFLQVAICEGFGMPQVEAAACGVPIASVDYSAMTEIVRKLEGYPIPVKTLFRELETGADRANPDNEAIVDIIYDYFHMSQEKQQEKSKKTRELCEKYYSWDLVAEVWDRAFSSVDINDKPAWDCPRRETSSVKVPNELGSRAMIEFIINEIIMEPHLLETSPVQKLIMDFTCGFAASGKNAMVPLRSEEVIRQLQVLLKRKTGFENVRMNPEKLFQESYLHVNNQ